MADWRGAVMSWLPCIEGYDMGGAEGNVARATHLCQGALPAFAGSSVQPCALRPTSGPSRLRSCWDGAIEVTGIADPGQRIISARESMAERRRYGRRCRQ